MQYSWQCPEQFWAADHAVTLTGPLDHLEGDPVPVNFASHRHTLEGSVVAPAHCQLLVNPKLKSL